MQAIKKLLLATTLALSTGGCVSHARVSAGTQVGYDPTLVEVRPGLWVIEDYDRPVFYADNSYWLYSDGTWYRSGVYTGGWVRSRVVPRLVLQINQPHRYVHYRGGYRVRRGPHGRVIVRDRRPDDGSMGNPSYDRHDYRRHRR